MDDDFISLTSPKLLTLIFKQNMISVAKYQSFDSVARIEAVN